MSEVIAHLTHLEGLDRRLGEQRRLAEELSYQLQELARSLRDYRDGLEFDPQRLVQVEERLDLIFRLKRKYGDSIEEILAFGQRAAQELESLSHSEERTEELEEQEGQLLEELGELCSQLSAVRHEAVARLCSAIEEELAELRMEQTRFAVDLKRVEDPHGVEIEGRRYAFDATGVDRVEFLISPNPGEPLRPLAKIASGGEASRLMLAMKAVLSAADPVPTLIFDEIDAGIGGRVGEVIGKKLWGLTVPLPGHLSHQVICVTHLPQLAAFADAHYQVTKHVVGQRTVTAARPVVGEDRVEEVTQMLGATTAVTRQKASEMLEQTARWKAGRAAGLPAAGDEQRLAATAAEV
jgi:DNA repair protein RecN (Recombination protein N)